MSSRAHRAAAPRARSVVRHSRRHGHLNAGSHRRFFYHGNRPRPPDTENRPAVVELNGLMRSRPPARGVGGGGPRGAATTSWSTGGCTPPGAPQWPRPRPRRPAAGSRSRRRPRRARSLVRQASSGTLSSTCLSTRSRRWRPCHQGSLPSPHTPSVGRVQRCRAICLPRSRRRRWHARPDSRTSGEVRGARWPRRVCPPRGACWHPTRRRPWWLTPPRRQSTRSPVRSPRRPRRRRARPRWRCRAMPPSSRTQAIRSSLRRARASRPG